MCSGQTWIAASQEGTKARSRFSSPLPNDWRALRDIRRRGYKVPASNQDARAGPQASQSLWALRVLQCNKSSGMKQWNNARVYEALRSRGTWLITHTHSHTYTHTLVSLVVKGLIVTRAVSELRRTVLTDCQESTRGIFAAAGPESDRRTRAGRHGRAAAPDARSCGRGDERTPRPVSAHSGQHRSDWRRRKEAGHWRHFTTDHDHHWPESGRGAGQVSCHSSHPKIWNIYIDFHLQDANDTWLIRE